MQAVAPASVECEPADAIQFNAIALALENRHELGEFRYDLDAKEWTNRHPSDAHFHKGTLQGSGKVMGVLVGRAGLWGDRGLSRVQLFPLSLRKVDAVERF